MQRGHTRPLYMSILKLNKAFMFVFALSKFAALKLLGDPTFDFRDTQQKLFRVRFKKINLLCIYLSFFSFITWSLDGSIIIIEKLIIGFNNFSLKQ